MRIVAGIILGLVLFFPGITLLQWVAEDLLGQQMTLTDGCLVMIIILLSVIIVTRIHVERKRQPTGRQQPTAAGQEPTPYSRSTSATSQRRSTRRLDRRRP